MVAARHIELAAKVPGASKNVMTHSVHVSTSANNVVKRADETIAVAQQIRAATTAGEAAPHTAHLNMLAQQLCAGLRAVQMTKQTLTALKMVPVVEAVTIPFVAKAIDREAGVFKATEQHDKAAVTMFNELHRWTAALASLRA